MKKSIIFSFLLIPTFVSAEVYFNQWNIIENKSMYEFIKDGYTLSSTIYEKEDNEDGTNNDRKNFYLQKDDHLVVCYEGRAYDLGGAYYEYNGCWELIDAINKQMAFS